MIEAAGLGNLRVFGSVARGEDAAESDIDILVELGDARNVLDVYVASDELSKRLGVCVDLFCPQVAKPSVLNGALRDAIAL